MEGTNCPNSKCDKKNQCSELLKSIKNARANLYLALMGGMSDLENEYSTELQNLLDKYNSLKNAMNCGEISDAA